MSLTLTKIAETSSTLTLGWTPPADAEWYLFYADSKRVSNAAAVDKNGNVKSSVKFSKGAATYYVVCTTKQGTTWATQTGSYPSAAPLPPNVSQSAPTPQVTP